MWWMRRSLRSFALKRIHRAAAPKRRRMYKLYIMEASPLLETEKQKQALAIVDRDRRERALSLKKESDRALSLAAGLLLFAALGEYKKDASVEPDESGISGREPGIITVEQALLLRAKDKGAFGDSANGKDEIIKRREDGKPYLAGQPRVYFNLSHSGEYALCALSDREVGVDIQKWRETVPGTGKKLLCRESPELDFERKKEASVKDRAAFFLLWSAKEAYVKATGEGLSKDFRELYVDFKAGSVRDTVSGRVKKLYIFGFLSGYSMALCE